MIKMAVAAITLASFVTVSSASWAQVGVGGNAVAKYPSVEASKNRKVTNSGVGGNAEPKYAATPASKNRTVSNHGAGGNATPTYPKVGTH